MANLGYWGPMAGPKDLKLSETNYFQLTLSAPLSLWLYGQVVVGKRQATKPGDNNALLQKFVGSFESIERREIRPTA